MESSLWAVIPMKRLGAAKSRLGGALTATRRRDLARDMFAHVLQVATDAKVAGVMVVTGDGTIESLSRAAGAAVLRRPVDDGVARAAGAGLRAAMARGASTVLVMPADLPDLTSADVDALLRASGDVIIAPAKDGGTNALRVPVGRDFRFQFGPGSAALHQAEAVRLGFSCVLVRRAGLARDVDTPADLAIRAA